MNQWLKKLEKGKKEGLERIKKDKKLLFLLLAGIAGMVILLLSELIPSGDAAQETKDTQTAAQAAIGQQTYVEDIETRLAQIITSISGAGRTKVMVTLENSEESVWATQGKTTREQGGTDGSQKYSSEDEYVLIRSSGSEEGGLLLKIVQPKIRGVAIVCDGGDNVYVREKITTAVASVLDISTAKISIAKMASNK